jgi:hypothetical protein
VSRKQADQTMRLLTAQMEAMGRNVATEVQELPNMPRSRHVRTLHGQLLDMEDKAQIPPSLKQLYERFARPNTSPAGTAGLLQTETTAPPTTAAADRRRADWGLRPGEVPYGPHGPGAEYPMRSASAPRISNRKDQEPPLMNMAMSGSCTLWRPKHKFPGQPTLQVLSKWGSVVVRSFGDPPAAGEEESSAGLSTSPIGPGYYKIPTTICSPNPYTNTPHLTRGGFSFSKPPHMVETSKFKTLAMGETGNYFM